MYKIAQGCSKIPDHLGNVKISFNLKKMLLKVKLENDQKTMKIEKKVEEFRKLWWTLYKYTLQHSEVNIVIEADI